MARIEHSYAVVAADLRVSRVFSFVDDIMSSRGMWRCEPGNYEFETDEEFFTIVQGNAKVKFENGTTMELHAGMTGYFRKGEHTSWTITSTIIKTYQTFRHGNIEIEKSSALDANRVALEPEAMETDKSWVTEGNPDVSSAIMAMYNFDRVLCGVWRCSPGSVTYVEEDEIFTVIEGKAIVTIHDGTVLELFPGVIGEFKRGDVATFEVFETFLKTFQITLPADG
jgi:uncharacterized cupin superfamily protein